jgi:hypothetical protein
VFGPNCSRARFKRHSFLRTAYNVQFSTDTASQIIVGVEVATCGSDPGQMAPMVEQIHEQPKDASTDRYAPRATDSVAVAAWRQRMASAEAQAIYKDRAATVECVNALARNRGLRQQTSVSSAAKAGGIREVSAEDEKTNFFTDSDKTAFIPSTAKLRRSKSNVSGRSSSLW